MNTGQLNLALKMIQEDYKLTPGQLEILSRRLIADDKEFEKFWNAFKSRRLGKVDTFADVLKELLS